MIGDRAGRSDLSPVRCRLVLAGAAGALVGVEDAQLLALARLSTKLVRHNAGALATIEGGELPSDDLRDLSSSPLRSADDACCYLTAESHGCNSVMNL